MQNTKIGLILGDKPSEKINNSVKEILKKLSTKFKLGLDYELFSAGQEYCDKESVLVSKSISKASDSCSTILHCSIKSQINSGSIKSQTGNQDLIKILKAKLRLDTRVISLNFQKFSDHLDSNYTPTFNNIDIVSDIYSGIHEGGPNERREMGKIAIDTTTYYYEEIQKVIQTAFESANQSKKQLVFITNIDGEKAKELWEEIFEETKTSYPDVLFKVVSYGHMLLNFEKTIGSEAVVICNSEYADNLVSYLKSTFKKDGLFTTIYKGRLFNLFGELVLDGLNFDLEYEGSLFTQLLSVVELLNIINQPEASKYLEDSISKVLSKGNLPKELAQKSDTKSKELSDSEFAKKLLEQL
jgi:isocitrate/isopropylmalate dehydrogenase